MSGDAYAGWTPPEPRPSLSRSLVTGGLGELGSGRVVGEARGIQVRSEQDPLISERQVIVLAFNVERFDEAGNRLRPVPVELRGRTVRGALNEGDRVDVAAAHAPTGTLHVDRVRNLTTGADVRASGGGHPAIYWVVFGITGVIVLVILVVAVLIIASVAGGSPTNG